ncbi:hypothetical protein AGMMS49983_16870 [Clostridia bacterium]|nr:hypothetical protein AGMMS49983_16870 [Clostridia bacterium]
MKGNVIMNVRKMLAGALATVIAVGTLTAGAWMPGFGQAAYAGEESVTLIGAQETWKYSDTNTDLFGDVTSDFRSKDFDDAAWKSGPAPLGYPATDQSQFFGPVSGGTLVASKGSPNAYITYYFRKGFAVEDPAQITKLTARVAIDDGVVLWLNGNKIGTINMPAGDANASTTAPGVWEPSEDRANVTLDLTAYKQFLVVGPNTIAADVHNRDSNSSDIYFGMDLTATFAESGESGESDEGEGEGGEEPGTPAADPAMKPEQLNVHVGDDAQTQVNVTYTTIAAQVSTITLTAAKDGAQPFTVTGGSSPGASDKYFHKISVNGLEADTTYHYTAGVAPNTVDGKFKTAPASADATIKFVYLADTQVSNADNAESLGATLAEVNAMNPDFVYLAGDVTDTATSEAQWEWLFKNGGAFPTGGADMFTNYLVAAVQGNHDNNTFNRHINAPAKMGNIVYDFDYGPVTFIMLNIEAANSSATARGEQKAFLEQKIADAKARGQWTAVGFHKSLYTGASHVVDSDVVAMRKYWCPIFAQLDVDFVLQGHDHVYSRGFVTESGYKADVEQSENGATIDPAYAPLYMIGGHAGGLKWYSRINYTVGTGDPIAPGYSFLDVDSADPAQDPLGRNKGSDTLQEQVIVEFEVSKTSATINSYMFKYNEATDTITTPKYLYDTLTVERGAGGGNETPTQPTARISGPERAVVENAGKLTYTVSYKDLVGANAFDTAIEYDSAVLEYIGTDGIADNLYADVDTTVPGKIRIIQSVETANALTNTNYTDIARFVFMLKDGQTADTTSVKLTRADTVYVDENDILDVSALLETDEVVTKLVSEKKAADVNGDGKVTLADLSLAVSNYRAEGANIQGDVNGDGVVNIADFVIISAYIKAA